MDIKELLTDEALDFARRHLTKYYDTDFFPKPFEFNAIWYNWENLKSLPRKDLAMRSTPVALPWKKSKGGFRVVHQLNPLDSIVYTAMTYSIAKQIEEKRKATAHGSVCSYRIDIDGSGFFANGSGFEDYREKCEIYAEEFEYVLLTDISDFYNRIYLHRLENAISDATGSDKGKLFESFLMALNTKNSQGIPVGPPASIILSEASLIDVDEFIHSEGFKHVRYVDDIRIFGNSEKDLDGFLQKLTLYLHQTHRLGLVGEKTKIQISSEFLQQELNNQYQLEKLEIFNEIETSNHYSTNMDEEYDEDALEDDEEKPIGEKLIEAIERVSKYDHIDLGLVRAILRRAKWGKNEDLIEFVMNNIQWLRPVLNDAVLYIDSVTNENTISLIQQKLRQLIVDKELNDESSKLWMSWYIGNHELLSKDLHLRSIFMNATRLSNEARANVKAKKISWVRQKKENLLGEGPWNRRAIIFASQILTKDEKEAWLKPIKLNPALDIIDKWMIDWVLSGTPTAPPLPDPDSPIDFLDDFDF